MCSEVWACLERHGTALLCLPAFYDIVCRLYLHPLGVSFSCIVVISCLLGSSSKVGASGRVVEIFIAFWLPCGSHQQASHSSKSWSLVQVSSLVSNIIYTMEVCVPISSIHVLLHWWILSSSLWELIFLDWWCWIPSGCIWQVFVRR